MSGTTLAPVESSYPRRHVAPLVDTKAKWSDDWTTRPEIDFVSAVLAASGDDLSSAEIERRYGIIKQPWEDDFSTVSPLDLDGHWVRVTFYHDEGETVVFVGKIFAEPRMLHGSMRIPSGGGSLTESGVQAWTVYGPLQLLRQISVSRSYWEDKTDPIEWLPGMNLGTDEATQSSNRSSAVDEDDVVYVYGKDGDAWTNLQYAEYLLTKFVTPLDSSSPAWTITGQTELIGNLTAPIKFEPVETVASILRKIIPLDKAVDFYVQGFSRVIQVEDDDGELVEELSEGFEIVVYSLIGESTTAGGFTANANPNEIQIQIADQLDVANVNIVRSAEQLYDGVRVLGERVVVCCTLDAAEGDLVAGWTDDQETAYKAATSEVRKTDAYRNVFGLFTIPDDWDFLDGAASPSFDADGELEDDVVAPYQQVLRETLKWTPFLEGFDYATDPPTTSNESWVVADKRPAFALLYDDLDIDEDGLPIAGQFVFADRVDIDVSVPDAALGVFLSCDCNHFVAKRHWDDDEDDLDEGELEPGYDWEYMKATIAFEGDQRISVEHIETTLTDDATGEPKIKEIEIRGAQLWYVAPGTVIDVDEDGEPITLETGRIVKNDVDALRAALAPAIARYTKPRARAQLTFHGLLPWADYIGSILSVIEEGDSDTHDIDAPITSIEWRATGKPTTTLNAGFPR